VQNFTFRRRSPLRIRLSHVWFSLGLCVLAPVVVTGLDARAGELRSEMALSLPAEPRQALQQIAELLTRSRPMTSPQEGNVSSQRLALQLQDQSYIDPESGLQTKLLEPQLRSSWSLRNFQLIDSVETKDTSASAEALLRFDLGPTQLQARSLIIQGNLDLGRLNLNLGSVGDSRLDAEIRLDVRCEGLRVEVLSPLSVSARLRLNTDPMTAFRAEVLDAKIESSRAEPQFRIELGSCQGPAGISRWLEPALIAKLQQELQSSAYALELRRAAQAELDGWLNGQTQGLAWREYELHLRMIGAKPYGNQALLKFEFRLRHPMAPQLFIPWNRAEVTSPLAKTINSSRTGATRPVHDSQVAMLLPLNLTAEILALQLRHETFLIESQNISGFQSLMRSRWKQWFAFPELLKFSKSARFLFAVQLGEMNSSQPSSAQGPSTSSAQSLRLSCDPQNANNLQVQLAPLVQMLRQPTDPATTAMSSVAEPLPFAHFAIASQTTWSLDDQRIVRSQTHSRSHFDRRHKASGESFDSALLANGIDDALEGLRLSDLVPEIAAQLAAFSHLKCTDKWLQISPRKR
jgi:hypothetical protein